MLKKFVSSLLCVLMLVGCGSSTSAGAAASADAEKAVSELGLTDKVEKVEDRIIKGLFFFDEGTIDDASVYISNDKTADIVGVFKTSDPAAAKEKIEAYLVTLKGQMESYAPDEVFKVDNAVIEESSDKVVLIIADDIENARKVAQSLVK
ncbi:MAG: DUF4358 domain-containing protein [Solobacterium sp.]|nr:DUF4358 domain-containing protein [Solobacterium sp.]